MPNLPVESPINNVGYIRDTEYSIQINRWFLRPIGAWPISRQKTKTERVIAKALNITCQSLIVFTVVPCALYIIFEEKDVHFKLMAVGPMSHWMMGGMNYICLLLKSDEIIQCIQEIEEDWRIVKRTKDREIMLRNARVGRFIACISAACMQFGIMSYTINTGMTSTSISVGNETIFQHELPCPFYNEIVDSRVSPTNEIIFTTQIFSCFIANSVTVGACGLAAVLTMHACGQLNMLMSWFDDFVDHKTKDEKYIHEKLATIVRHHLRVLRFISRIEKIMHQICLVELVGCTLNLCMLGYYCITEWNKGETGSFTIYIVISVSMTFNIFIFCYIGEILIDQCKKVGEKAYMMEWHYLPHRAALSLILIILRSSTVTKITAGKLVQLSIPTFGDVIKTSVAYLNILRTVAV